MASETASVDAKQYLDRAVQTDILSTPASPELSSTSIVIRASSDRLSDMDISSSSIVSASSSQLASSGACDTSAYSHEDSSVLSSPPTSITTATRALRTTTTGGRCPGTVTLKTPGRVVSLPETVSSFAAKKVYQKTPRIVSNPERFKADLGSPTDSSFSSDQHSLDPFVLTAHHRPSRVRVQSSAADTPRTPSPPSSPESVVIIANKNHLSEGFLRGGARAEESVSSRADNDGGCCRFYGDEHGLTAIHSGWISWARSPPRPIPALHGPLSLPYARCPSYVFVFMTWQLTVNVSPAAPRGRSSKSQTASLA